MPRSHPLDSPLYLAAVRTGTSTTPGRQPKVISFSGVDGAGKTTQIDFLCDWLRDADLTVRRLTFWDDVAVLGRTRESLSHTMFKGETGVGSAANPIRRRDKDVRTWYTIPVRFLLYFLDALKLLFLCLHLSGASDADVIIFDRYLYDELANLNLNNSRTRAYIGFLLKFTPCPDVAFLLDADPAEACSRKPEYPLSFVHENRAAYLRLTAQAPGIMVIPPLPVEQVASQVQELISTNLFAHLMENVAQQTKKECAIPVDAGPAPAATNS